MSSTRERVAIVFMTVSVIATFALGGAVAHELGHPGSVLTGSANAAPTPGAIPSGASASPGASAAGVAGGSGQLSIKGEGVTGSTITVGGIYDETGPVDATVERDTVRAYFDKVNAQGGVNGHKLQLIDCDSGFDPTRAHQCSQQLLSQGVLAIVGWLSASGEQAETSYFNDQGVPVVGGLGVPSEFTSKLSFPTTANLVTFGTATGYHAKDLGIHAPGIVILNVPFIAPVKDSLLAALHKNGIREKSVDEVDATKADYSDIAVKLRSEGVDSIIAGLDPFSYARLFQAMDRQNFHPKFMGLGLDKTSANKQYGSSVYNAESLVPLLEPADHGNDASVQDYVGTVRRYFPNQVQALDIYSEGDWVAAKVFVEAIRRIGSQAINRKSLVDALNGISNFDTGLAKPFTYRAGEHDPDKCFEYIRDQKGQWTTYSGWKCY